MYLSAPITWPIAKVLDMLVGEHKMTRFNNAQLKEIIQLHHKESLELVHAEIPEGVTGLDKSQVQVMTGAVDLGTLSIHDIYTPIA